MTESQKLKIANSFPLNFDQAVLDICISEDEFKPFEDGIYAGSMDEKWNIFVLNNILFFARSWTNYCIFKVFIQRLDSKIFLQNFHVNRNKEQYNSSSIENDRVVLLKVFQLYAKREDLYVDPKFELKLIKNTIKKVDPDNIFSKSIGSDTVRSVKIIHTSLIENSSDFYEVEGWGDLKKKLLNKNDEQLLISLHMKHRKDMSSKTLYFDSNAEELLGEIIIKSKPRPDIFL